jgi:ETC complex I subunit conserved region
MHLPAALIQRPHFVRSQPMTIARISELDRKTTQSGKANAGSWLLEFERREPLRPDPLTGWNGSGDTNPQVRMTFRSRDAATAYCEKRGLKYHVVVAPPVRLRIQAYADNFR